MRQSKPQTSNPTMRPWPHAPGHWLFEPGIYMVTASTLHKVPRLTTPDRLDLMRDLLFTVADEFGWRLEAWALLQNHYHIVARSPDAGATTLPKMLGKLHMLSAKEINRQDKAPGRKVWFQFWETQLTYERSYLARLNYVQENPVHHGVATHAVAYPWCSAAWFEAKAPAAFVETVRRFRTDRVRVWDDY